MTHSEEPFSFGEDFSTEHALRMLELYSRTLKAMGFAPEPYPDLDERMGGRKFETPRFDTLNHAMWLCDETVDFVRQGRFAKAYRWIGMIQGILFMNGVFSLRELKEHNRFNLPPRPKMPGRE
ncbi:MAG: hypothetical protein WBI63_06910 [Coriobacteriia bacterium]